MRSEAMTLMEQRGFGVQAAGHALDHSFDQLVNELGIDRMPEVRASHGTWTACRHSADFPAHLTRFPRESDVPLVLYGVGRRELMGQVSESGALAIVGARRASTYGREIAHSLASDACRRGLVVVSGMALGIDGAAHRGALKVGGSTIAVLAGGPNRPYPRSHRLLYEQLIEEGCAISENPPGTEAKRWAFVARNRIIAGLASMTVWVEGTEQSGARHTLDFAAELDLPGGVVPGPISSRMSAGPNSRLGDAGVVPVRGIDDVLTELELELTPVTRPSTGGMTAGDAAILDLIASGVRTPRELARTMTASTPREIAQTLGRLELSGAVVRDQSGEYRRL